MRKINKNNLTSVFNALSSAMSLYIPVDTKGGANFKKYEDGDVMSDALKTVRSAKDFFFPQLQDIAEFKVDGQNIEVIDKRKAAEDFVVFGVRACDAKSFEILDRVFLVEPVDSYYATRREHGIIMTMACGKPSETCFCNTFSIDASNPAGDITCWDVDGYIYMKSNTEKGSKVMAIIDSLMEDGCDNKVESKKQEIKDTLAKLPLANLTSDKFGGGKTKEFWSDPAWAELSESCLGCGTCTFVCPTCQCYDIKDFNTGHGVVRFRCWDSCMYSDLSKMAHGNPRVSQLERFRQRFMHKLVYYPENNDGIFGCVGCGRCLAKCPISMNIVKVMKKLGGNK